MLAVLKVAPWAMSYRMHLVRTEFRVDLEHSLSSSSIMYRCSVESSIYVTGIGGLTSSYVTGIGALTSEECAGWERVDGTLGAVGPICNSVKLN